MNKEELERLKEIITESKQSHQAWLDYFKKYPEKSSHYANTAGDMSHHLQCIARYDEALKIVELLMKQPEPTELSNELRRIAKTQTRCFPDDWRGCWLPKLLRKAATELDRQAEEIKKLKETVEKGCYSLEDGVICPFLPETQALGKDE